MSESINTDLPVEDMPEPDLMDSVLWCIKNRGEISLHYNPDIGFAWVKCQVNNIFAEYEIDKPVTAETAGAALLNAIHAVEHGTRFHQMYGHYPPIDPTLPNGPPGHDE